MHHWVFINNFRTNLQLVAEKSAAIFGDLPGWYHGHYLSFIKGSLFSLILM